MTTTSIRTSTTTEKRNLVNPTTAGLSLKEIAHRVGVSPAYLLQVRHGVRPVSAKIKQELSKLAPEDLR
jgi:transcriptional regulator with XRE-family HTH domain